DVSLRKGDRAWMDGANYIEAQRQRLHCDSINDQIGRRFHRSLLATISVEGVVRYSKKIRAAGLLLLILIACRDSFSQEKAVLATPNDHYKQITRLLAQQ